MNDAEREFQAENGMSMSQAWDYVLRWKGEGKISQAKKGCQEIIKFFPDHQASQALLDKILQEEEVSPKSEDIPELLPKEKVKTKKALLNFFSMQPTTSNAKPVTENERILGVICYLWILVLIPLFMKRDSEYTQFHAWQGLVLTGGLYFFFVIASNVLRVMGLGIITVIISSLTSCIYLYLAFSAYTGRWLKIPFIYPLSEKLRRLF